MKYGGNFSTNFSNAEGAKDLVLQRAILLDEIAHLLKMYPHIVAGALRNSGVVINDGYTMKELIDKTIHNLSRNAEFKVRLAELIAGLNTGQLDQVIQNFAYPEYSNGFGGAGDVDTGAQLSNLLSTTGSATASGASSGGVAGGIIGAVVGLTDSIFSWAGAKETAEAEEAKAKSELMQKLLGGDEGINWIPVVIIGGVLLIGGVVAYLTLTTKK